MSNPIISETKVKANRRVCVTVTPGVYDWEPVEPILLRITADAGRGAEQWTKEIDPTAKVAFTIGGYRKGDTVEIVAEVIDSEDTLAAISDAVTIDIDPEGETVHVVQQQVFDLIRDGMPYGYNGREIELFEWPDQTPRPLFEQPEFRNYPVLECHNAQVAERTAGAGWVAKTIEVMFVLYEAGTDEGQCVANLNGYFEQISRYLDSIPNLGMAGLGVINDSHSYKITEPQRSIEDADIFELVFSVIVPTITEG